MKWSVDELLAIMAKGKEAIDADIIKKLDNPQNKDIFDTQNFSLLLGVIGITGIKNASLATQQNIWNSIKESEILDAHDKGILSNWIQNTAAKYEDNRLCAWINLDNYEASAKFNIILWDILKNNASLTDEISPYCLDGVKLVESLARTMLIPQLETYLEQLRGQGAACGMSGTAITAVYEKEAVLRKLCNIIAKARRKLNVAEKKYLYIYLQEAYLDGFEAQNIGMDDAMLARLMIDDEDLTGLSELEANDLLQHNWNIAQFSLELEKKDGFFEQTASKLIHIDNSHITAMVERCLSQISNQEKPKGILFALELVNLNQIKTAVTILIELAQKGRATEVISFLHRLLPKAKGSELMIMKVLKLNLHNLHLNEVIAGNIGVKEYITRMYLNAVDTFAEIKLYKEATELLQELAQGGWFAGLPDLVDGFAKSANSIIEKDKNFAVNLCAIAKKLQLKIYNENGNIFVGRPEKSPIKIEDVVEIIEEKEKYDVYNKPEPLLAEDKISIVDEPIIEPQLLETENTTVKEDIIKEENIKEDEIKNDNIELVKNSDEQVQTPPITINKTEELEISATNDLEAIEGVQAIDTAPIPEDTNNQQNNDDNTVTDIEEETIPPKIEEIAEDTAVIEEYENQEKDKEDDLSAINIELPNIENWQDTEDDLVNNDTPEVNGKININNILKITTKDIDKHFSTMKDITSKAISRAAEIKSKVEKSKIASSKSVAKIKELAQKIKFIKKK